MQQEQPDQAPGSTKGKSRTLYIVIALAALILLVQLIALRDPRGGDKIAMEQETATRPRPTRSFTPTTPTSTPIPPTNTPTRTPTATLIPPTATALPPTATPLPPTATPLPPTPTPVPPTETPIPPTATRIPPTPKPKPPTATPVPVTVLDSVEIDNGEWGKDRISVKYPEEIWITADDGHKYRAEIGFLSTPESLGAVQEFWGYAARGSANWKMFVLLRTKVNWTTCVAKSNTCYEIRTSSSQASVTAEIFYKDHVWKSVLRDYLAGGWHAVAGNQYYYEIQASVFHPICPHCNAVPNVPVVGFKFTRVD